MAVASGDTRHRTARLLTREAPACAARWAVWLANGLTAFRLITALPLYLLIVEGHEGWALALFLLAATSDGADGYVARRFDARTSLGAALDPLADKVLVGAACLALVHVEAVPIALAVLVIGRDVLLLLVGARALTCGHRRTIEPLAIGKFSTLTQLAFLGVVLTSLAGIAPFGLLTVPIMVLACLLTLASLLAYAISWWGGAARPWRQA